MRFMRDENGEMVLSKQIVEMKKSIQTPSAYIIDMPRIRESIKSGEILRNKSFSIMPISVMGMATGIHGTGIFWDTFLTYIFPYMLDIAKVFCAIKIAQAFYEEKRGGSNSATGMASFVTYGKWYLLFVLTPWMVELVDQLGGKMLTGLHTTP
jgi:hypothetical protein